ncbi:gliding motility-associated C-terminal domain-containing protein [Phaeocystidibacter luteus]|uniref:Gliding motility-associated C-terminal domain-containing protein n=1 Tax=Phaeocystidibacter luteus TaxID=911197 RepID=A0A6N6REQ8_9FLAO|nr:gliding motility-associated C-terminal domain-containing protein [Phaeocystidibacter luteus]KAB2808687.1 gliding motility-associated C-terminal domain-containing protein [Phaeocystidibacter luteus]
MKYLLRLLTVVLFGLMSMPASASHVIGGDIQYEYLGNNQYYVKLVIYRQSTGAGLPATTNVNVSSQTCGINTSVSLTRTSVYSASSFAFDCIAQSNAGGFLPEVNVYETTTSSPLTLTQRCTDYKLSWSLCCRPGGITNIGGGASSAGFSFYFEAELNNRQGLGNNTSPSFVSDPIAYICTGGFINYLQRATEPDGDSIRYEIIDPRSAAGTNVPYTAPWSAQAPFGTDPNAPYTMDPATGNISFIADLQGGPTQVSVIALRVDEYRFDSTYFFWEKVGSSNREIQVVVAANCIPAVNQGVRLDPNAPGVSLDPQGRQTKDYKCYDSTVTLHFTLSVECISVAPDGTDFRLTAPNGQPIPVKSVTSYCNQNGETDSITLNLYKPLIFNGDYFLYSKYGTDGNTLLNKCGKPMNEFDTIILKVSDCLFPEYYLDGVTVDQDRRNRIDYRIDTNTIPAAFLDFVRIYRSVDGGQTFNQLTTGDPLQGFVFDPSPGPSGVDNQYYYYRVQLVANGLELDPRPGKHTIHLTGDVSDPANMPLSWSSYGGASFPDLNSVQYKVQVGPKNDTDGYDFQDVIDPNLPTGDSTFTVVLTTNPTPGDYAVRVITEPIANPNGYVSESNWLIYSVPEEPIVPPVGAQPVIIPNVFSPNADGINDLWTIEGIGTWSSRKVSIFDRWGRKVWNTSQYDNARAFDGKDSGGNQLPDGTYFYVIELNHAPTGQSEVIDGSFSIMSGNN